MKLTSLPLIAILLAGCLSLSAADSSRNTISLDGSWQIAEEHMGVVPDSFSRTVPVPGLVDMAEPPFEHVHQNAHKDPHRDAYWYRREFVVDQVPDLARLKIHKAMFGSKVFLNDQDLGEHAPSFTPAYYDVTKVLRSGKNEIKIRVGADMASIQDKAVPPIDGEKIYYIPGIFDSVELICSGTPFIENIQTVPDIKNKRVRVVTHLVNTGEATDFQLRLTVKEWKSGETVGTWTGKIMKIKAGADETVEAVIPVPQCKFWSPESPFLYLLEAKTDSDSSQTRFGMREFRFNPKTCVGELNGKPYMLRGSNFTVYRFFEDSERKALPWDKNWVRLLHERVKDIHWNSLRYCIGFPPEYWYDMADEVGILIQDEFPIWGIVPGHYDHLVREYTEWMRERWNHPSVVIWDACNETVSQETLDAAAVVRKLDLSNRPWDNGYNPPAQPGDVFESHPYHFSNPSCKLRDLAHLDRVPQGNVTPNHQTHPVIINEYAWLWLNRDGSLPRLTAKLYNNLCGPDATPEERFTKGAKYLAAETEFFRAYRHAAGVLHFTMLGYSRPDGHTCDEWANVEKLEWEPMFYRYVRDAFAPVGLMIEYWEDRVPVGKGERVTIPVILINDLDRPWQGDVTFRVRQNDKVLYENSRKAKIKPWNTLKTSFDFNWPRELGDYQLEASLTGEDGEPVSSIRDFQVVEHFRIPLEIRDVFASSTYQPEKHAPHKAIDGNSSTYWSSEFRDDEWIRFDLGKSRNVNRFVIQWENAYSRKYGIDVSNDGENWTKVFHQDQGDGGEETVSLPEAVTCRYIRLNCLERGPHQWGNAIYSFEVYEP